MKMSEFELLMAAELAAFRSEWVRDHPEMDLTPVEWYFRFTRYVKQRTGLRSALP